MHIRNAKSAIEYIAKQEGKKVDEIRKEISIAIDMAYDDRKNHSKWQEVFGDSKPSPEEFIEMIVHEIEKEQHR